MDVVNLKFMPLSNPLPYNKKKYEPWIESFWKIFCEKERMLEISSQNAFYLFHDRFHHFE